MWSTSTVILQNLKFTQLILTIRDLTLFTYFIDILLAKRTLSEKFPISILSREQPIRRGNWLTFFGWALSYIDGFDRSSIKLISASFRFLETTKCSRENLILKNFRKKSYNGMYNTQVRKLFRFIDWFGNIFV